MNNKIIVLVLFFFLVSCQSPLQFYEKYTGTEIAVGSYGGVSGEEKKFVLIENGNLYKISSLTRDTVFLAKLDQENSKQVFNNYNVLGLEQMNISGHGNMNYFVEYGNGVKKHKFSWSNGTGAKTNANLFYDFFMSFVRNLKK